MKKALFILGGVAMFAFASCDNKSDCECGAKVTVEGMEVSIPSLGSVTEFDGDCDAINASDLGPDWANIEELGGSFKCVEQ